MTRGLNLRERLSGWGRDRQFRNLGWFGLAEGLVRVSRLVTLVVLARLIDAGELGTAALALMLFELVRTVGAAGLGQMIVRASADDLAATCQAVYRTAWMMALAMGTVLALLGAGFAPSDRGDWPLLLACLAVVYAAWPLTLVRHFLIVRADRLGRIAAILAVTVVADNLLTALLALFGCGVWSIIVPKVLVLPVWFLGIWHGAPQPPRLAPGGVALGVRDVLRFVVPVMGSEGLGALRQHADKLLVGVMLGPSALGLYYLAYNAGIGLSLTLTTALATTAFPHLAEASGQRSEVLHRLDRLMRRQAVVVSALIALQAVLIPLYVPLLLGSRWIEVPPLAILLCIGALSRPPMEVAAQALRAVGATRFEFVSSLLFTSVSLGCFAIGLAAGLTTGVALFALVSFAGQVAFTLWARSVVKDAPVVPGGSPGSRAATPAGA